MVGVTIRMPGDGIQADKDGFPGMKDDLTNRITGTITADGGFPLVVKVRHLPIPSIVVTANTFTTQSQ